MKHQMFDRVIRFCAPAGLVDAVADAAAREAKSTSEFVRSATLAALKQRGIEPRLMAESRPGAR